MAEEAEVLERKKGWRGKLWILIAVLVLVAVGEVGRRTWIYFQGAKSAKAAGRSWQGRGRIISEAPTRARGKRQRSQQASIPFW